MKTFGIGTPELQAAFERVRAMPKISWTPEETAAIKAGGRITRAAQWDCATRDERIALRPDLDPDQRWYQQKAWMK